jgi:predicted nucleic acid-binding protein
MRAISDSGPLIHLAVVGHFDLLRLYFSELLVLPGVYQEVAEAGRGSPGSHETKEGVKAGWIKITELQDLSRTAPFLQQGMTWTDSCVVALALENRTDVLLSDDLTVRTRALSEGLRVVGTIGILIDGKLDGHLPNLREVLDHLIRSGFYLNPNGPVYKEALRLAGET